MKKYLLMIFGCAVYATGWAQYAAADTLNLFPVSPTELWPKIPRDDKLRPKRIPPVQATLPTCSYANGQIWMATGEEWGAFAYYVLTDERETVLSGSGFLFSHTPYFIDLSPLASGCYTFVLQHGGYYGASFVH